MKIFSRQEFEKAINNDKLKSLPIHLGEAISTINDNIENTIGVVNSISIKDDNTVEVEWTRLETPSAMIYEEISNEGVDLTFNMSAVGIIEDKHLYIKDLEILGFYIQVRDPME